VGKESGLERGLRNTNTVQGEIQGGTDTPILHPDAPQYNRTGKKKKQTSQGRSKGGGLEEDASEMVGYVHIPKLDRALEENKSTFVAGNPRAGKSREERAYQKRKSPFLTQAKDRQGRNSARTRRSTLLPRIAAYNCDLRRKKTGGRHSSLVITGTSLCPMPSGRNTPQQAEKKQTMNARWRMGGSITLEKRRVAEARKKGKVKKGHI